jgi:hypothetical protein
MDEVLTCEGNGIVIHILYIYNLCKEIIYHSRHDGETFLQCRLQILMYLREYTYELYT